jgi:hypothetical protein
MNSERYPHKVAAVYPGSTAADMAIEALEQSKLGDARIIRLAPGASEVDAGIEAEPDRTRRTVAKNTLATTVVGTTAGAVVAGATATLAPTLFVSAPVVGPLIILGYGALIGGTAGAVHGLKLREIMLSSLVKDALMAGYYVVIVHAVSEQVLHRAEQVIDATLAEKTAHT